MDKSEAIGAMLALVLVAFVTRIGWELGGLLVRLLSATWDLLVSS